MYTGNDTAQSGTDTDLFVILREKTVLFNGDKTDVSKRVYTAPVLALQVRQHTGFFYTSTNHPIELRKYSTVQTPNDIVAYTRLRKRYDLAGSPTRRCVFFTRETVHMPSTYFDTANVFRYCRVSRDRLHDLLGGSRRLGFNPRPPGLGRLSLRARQSF